MKITVSAAYVVILLFSIWIVLNPQVPTKVIGTASFSSIGLAAFLSIVDPNNESIDLAEVWLALSTAIMCVWFFLRWMRRRKRYGTFD